MRGRGRPLYGRLFRRDRFEPIAAPLEHVLLVQQGVPYEGDTGGPWWRVANVEEVPGVGAHGFTFLWTGTTVGATVPAGYGSSFPTGITTNLAIPSLGSITSNPATLQVSRKQLFGFRFLFKHLATLTGVLDDYDLSVNLPSAFQRWSLPQAGVQGVWNARLQSSLPSDTVIEPAQGANLGQPTLYDFHDPFLFSPELFIWEQNTPVWTITNLGSASATGGALGLQVRGFKYDMIEVNPSAADGWYEAPGFTESSRMLFPPDDFVVVPIGGSGR